MTTRPIAAAKQRRTRIQAHTQASMATIPLNASTNDTAPGASCAVCPTRQLIRGVVIAYVIAALVLVAILLLAVRADWWRAFAAASVVNIAAAATSVPVVAWGLRHGLRRPEILTGAYMAAMFVRAVISLGGAAAAIMLGGYPKSATLLMVVPYYLSILAAETLVVARLLLKSDAGRSHEARPSASTPAETNHA
jgi:hypothetical protein